MNIQKRYLQGTHPTASECVKELLGYVGILTTTTCSRAVLLVFSCRAQRGSRDSASWFCPRNLAFPVYCPNEIGVVTAFPRCIVIVSRHCTGSLQHPNRLEWIFLVATWTARCHSQLASTYLASDKRTAVTLSWFNVRANSTIAAVIIHLG